jgi:two-component system NarL family sensor kinase
MNDMNIVVAMILSTLVILVLILVVIITILLATRQNIKQKMDLAEARLNYEKELRKVEMEISESIMEQFSQELHDNIGHILTSMRITIENKKIDHPELNNVFPSVEGYLNDATQQLRLLSKSLNKDYLNNVGLVDAIQIETERLLQLNRFQVHLHNGVSVVGTGLDKNQELIVFRIFQEIIHNSMKHARAKNVSIILKNEDTFILQVNDDGRGFDVEATLHSYKGSGLKNIIKRAQMANMDYAIISSPGEGCKYTLQQKKMINTE